MLAACLGFAFGAFIGSFLNVCIHRLTRNESVVHPPSRCYGCGTLVQWYDNVPLLSWLLLCGRCRWCGAPFSIRYWLLELGTGLVTGALAWAVFGSHHLGQSVWLGFAPSVTGQAVVLGLTLAGLLVLAWFLIVAAVIDAEHTIIPDELTKPLQLLAPFLAAAAGVVLDLGWHPIAWLTQPDPLGGFRSGLLALALPALFGLPLSLPVARWIYSRYTANAPWSADDHRGFAVGVWWFAGCTAFQLAVAVALLTMGGPWTGAAGALLGAAILGSLAGWWSLYLVGLLGTMAFKRNAMGFGDVKFLAPIGAFLGPLGVVYAFFAAAVVGAIIGLPLRLLGRRELPFGPYLVLGTLVVLAAGPQLARWWSATFMPAF